jgi:hypothetical protein
MLDNKLPSNIVEAALALAIGDRDLNRRLMFPLR